MKNILIEWEEAMKLRDRFERDPIISDHIYGLTLDSWEKIRSDENANIVFIFSVYVLEGCMLMSHIIANGLSWLVPLICVNPDAIDEYDI